MMLSTTRRRAVTLVEVLIAIFLMGIGLMAILSLFPLGAAQMAQALKDQRCAEAMTNADAMSRVIWKQACEDDLSSGAQKFYAADGITPQSRQRFVMAMDRPEYAPAATPADYTLPAPATPGQARGVPTSTTNNPAMPIPIGASYPVFVDSIGFQANAISNANQWWLPTLTVNSVTWRIPRRPLYHRDTSATAIPSGWSQVPWIPLGSTSVAGSNGTFTASAQRIFKQFSLVDDMTFNFNGTPDLDGNLSTAESAALAASQGVQRQGRYTYAYMFRRPKNADRTTVDISTIVYSGRSIDVPSAETPFLATAVDLKSLTVVYSGTKPAIRRGQWILDATLNDSSGNVVPQGYFYRVVNVDDNTAGSLGLELQTPLLGGPALGQPRVIIVMDNVVEVFTRNEVTAVSPPMPY